jgi:hypothetical protein
VMLLTGTWWYGSMAAILLPGSGRINLPFCCCWWYWCCWMAVADAADLQVRLFYASTFLEMLYAMSSF